MRCESEDYFSIQGMANRFFLLFFVYFVLPNYDCEEKAGIYAGGKTTSV